MHLAIIHGQIQLDDFLSTFNADPNAKDAEGETAFTMAVYLVKDRKISCPTHAALLRLLFKQTQEDIPAAEDTCALVSAVKDADLTAAAILLRRAANGHNWSNAFAATENCQLKGGRRNDGVTEGKYRGTDDCKIEVFRCDQAKSPRDSKYEERRQPCIPAVIH